MKKIISLVLAVLMLVSAIPMAASAANETKWIELTYNGGVYRVQTDIYNKKKVYYIELVSQDCAAYHNTAYEMPDYLDYDGYQGKINAIKYNAFKNHSGITELTLPAYVTDITCVKGFTCLKKLNISENVETISSDLSYHSPNLEEISVSPYNKYFKDDNPFSGGLYDKDFTKIIMYPPAREENILYLKYDLDIINIGEYAFYNSTKLKQLVIYPGTEIGDYAFKNSQIETIHFPGTQEEWNETIKDFKCCGNRDCWFCNGKTKICFGTYYETIEPTCTEKGLTSGTYCDTLGKWVVERRELGSSGHSYSNSEYNYDSIMPCTIHGTITQNCRHCGDEKIVENPSLLSHSYSNYQKYMDPEDCTQFTYYRAYCDYGCGKYDTTLNMSEIGPHIDDNHDAMCDKCNHNNASNCSHMCHKNRGKGTGWYRFCLFFWKLFKINRECSCGKYHY